MPITTSQQLFSRAKQHMPGGVNSPVRAFKAVGGQPIFIKRAQGPHLIDEDDNRYVELINSWGPMILGHAHPAVEEAVARAMKDGFSFGAPTRREVEMAELVCSMVPGADMVRMVNSGTEACLSAIRVARGATGRPKIIKFEGCYHGHADSFLIAAGSGVATLGVPDSPGVTPNTAQDTLTAEYNNLASVQLLIDANPGQIAAIIVEPVAGNMGCVAPDPDFLPGLRQLCDAHGIVLIFDEVMTGFRLAPGGAQELYGVQADLVTLGKVIGGGMPVGAYAGKRELMSQVAPLGSIYQAGTLSGNPLAMAAGMTQLQILKENPGIYEQLDATTQQIENIWRSAWAPTGMDFTINRVGSMITLFFTQQPVHNFSDAKTSQLLAFAAWFQSHLNAGVYLAPSQFESLFISTAIDQACLAQIEQAAQQAVAHLQQTLFADRTANA